MTPQAFNQMIQDDIARMMKPTDYVAECYAEDGEFKVLFLKAYSVDEAYEQAYEQTVGFCETGEIAVKLNKGQHDKCDDDYEGYYPRRRTWASA